MLFKSVIVDQTPQMRALTERVNQRLDSAYKPKTWSAYKAMFCMFLSFCIFMKTDHIYPRLPTVLGFIEFLTFNGLKYASVLNYISAIKSQMKWFDLDTQVLEHSKVKLMLKAIEQTSTCIPVYKGVFDVPTLTRLIQLCRQFPYHLTFQALYLLAFFGFFRISNLVPASRFVFDIKKQLCRGDVIIQPSNAIVIVKWSKTLQNIKKGTFVIIPRLGRSPLCPVKALETMLQTSSQHTNAPLFTTTEGILTQNQVRTHLAKLLHALKLDGKSYSFHTFRRSGATLAFNSNVSIQNIKRHGTWSSDTVYTYILSDPSKASAVSDSFQHLLAT